jgi:hypothetical protein
VATFLPADGDNSEDADTISSRGARQEAASSDVLPLTSASTMRAVDAVAALKERLRRSVNRRALLDS